MDESFVKKTKLEEQLTTTIEDIPSDVFKGVLLDFLERKDVSSFSRSEKFLMDIAEDYLQENYKIRLDVFAKHLKGGYVYEDLNVLKMNKVRHLKIKKHLTFPYYKFPELESVEIEIRLPEYQSIALDFFHLIENLNTLNISNLHREKPFIFVVPKKVSKLMLGGLIHIKGEIPDSVIHLEIDGEVSTIDKKMVVFPKRIEYLFIYQKKLPSDLKISHTLKTLDIEDDSDLLNLPVGPDNEKLNNLIVLKARNDFLNPANIPSSLKKLSIKNVISEIKFPPMLEYLKMEKYRYSLTTPKTLKTLILNHSFKHSTGLYLNEGLEILKMKDYISNNPNIHVELELPSTLLALKVNGFVDAQFKLPKKLKVFFEPFEYKYNIDYPESLEDLIIPHTIVGPKFKFPQKLKKLAFLSSPEGELTLPESLEVLEFGTNEIYPIPINLPPKLKIFIMPRNYNLSSDLPENLEILYMSPDFNNRIKLPLTINTLSMGMDFNQEIILPSNLENLTLGKHFDKPLILPDSLQIFDMTLSDFNMPIKKIPSSLKVFYMGDNFNQPLDLPEGLIKLQIGKKFNQKLKLPNTLRVIRILSEYKLQLEGNPKLDILYSTKHYPMLNKIAYPWEFVE